MAGKSCRNSLIAYLVVAFFVIFLIKKLVETVQDAISKTQKGVAKTTLGDIVEIMINITTGAANSLGKATGINGWLILFGIIFLFWLAKKGSKTV